MPSAPSWKCRGRTITGVEANVPAEAESSAQGGRADIAVGKKKSEHESEDEQDGLQKREQGTEQKNNE